LTPTISFGILRFGLAFNLPTVINAMFDQEIFLQTVAEDLAPLLSGTSASDSQGLLSPPANEARVIVMESVHKTLPIILKSLTLLSNNFKNSSGAPNHAVNLLPVLLQIQPSVWNEWEAKAAQGFVTLGECRQNSSRAACEVTITGPREQQVSLALLFNREFCRWRLTGVSGLMPLITAMRAESKHN
jgi:hypothetical protein